MRRMVTEIVFRFLGVGDETKCYWFLPGGVGRMGRRTRGVIIMIIIIIT